MDTALDLQETLDLLQDTLDKAAVVDFAEAAPIITLDLPLEPLDKVTIPALPMVIRDMVTAVVQDLDPMARLRVPTQEILS